MVFTDLFAGEIVTELLKQLLLISRKSCLCKSSADSLISYLNQLIPLIDEVKYSGVEMSALRQFELDRFSETLREGLELAQKVLASARWNVYKNLMLARRMEKLEKKISRFFQGPMQVHLWADVHHLRFENKERLDLLEGRLEKRLGELKIGVCGGGGGGWMEEAIKKAEEEDQKWDGSLVNLGLDLGKKKVKEMVIGREDLRVVGICGIGGSGKTTLAREFIRDEEVRTHFNDKIFFLTVSQSPNVEELRARIWGFIMGNPNLDPNTSIPAWNLQYDPIIRTQKLVVLDDVWSLEVLQKLIFNIPDCKTLVVSRFRYTEVLGATYEMELLREHEAISLFCLSAFGQKSFPPATDVNLVKQIVNECKGLPLALKVIGSSLRDQPPMYWASAKSRLSKGEPINESHENNLLERMAISVNCLSKKVRECFLDLGAFPEDKKIPLDILISIWVELHGIDEEEAFAILVELSNKNLLTLVKDTRDGDVYSSCYDIAITQHDVLRDLALHLSSRDDINKRERLLMPRREGGLPREWEKNSNNPFYAQIVSIHTGEMNEMDWCQLEFPKAEVLILNFASDEFFLPPFLDNMPKLRALILINYGSNNANLRNFPSNLVNLRSLWLEKVYVPNLSSFTFPLMRLRKLSLVLCKIHNSFDQSVIDFPNTFPALMEFTIDHCDDLCELPSSFCGMVFLKNLSITNCHNFYQLPTDLGRLKCLQILRLYACPELKTLPSSICELHWLKYLDVSQCVKLSCLPSGLSELASLEKIDMRECAQIRSLPKSASSPRSLRHVVCDDEVSWLWQDVKKTLPNLHVQVAERYFDLDWLDD